MVERIWPKDVDRDFFEIIPSGKAAASRQAAEWT
jgi:hypothetical protein